MEKKLHSIFSLDNYVNPEVIIMWFVLNAVLFMKTPGRVSKWACFCTLLI